jgi:hypothetical protein
MRIIQAGPEQNAEARKRGARIDAFQKGLAARPLYRNAVTVWMEIAAGMENNRNGKTYFMFGSR